MHKVLKFLLISSLTIITATSAGATQLEAGLAMGYVMAPGAEIMAEVTNFADDLPFSLRLGVGHSRPAAGNALTARQVFINDATNGTPGSAGRAWTGRLDLVRGITGGPLTGVRVYGGPRYASFTANFIYVGGNEDFDVRSKHWGWGGGLEWRWPVGDVMSFNLGGGADWFLPARLQGHDTAYEPDRITGNERDDYTYQDADAAIDQPELEWRFGVSLSRGFGE